MSTDALVYLDEQTGEIVEPDNASLTLDMLNRYAEAKVALDVVRMNQRAYLARLAQTDPEYGWLVADERARELEIAAVEGALADLFSDELRLRHMRPISLDLGFLRITWPKAPERWVQRVKPEAIAKRDPDLAEQLGIECKVGDPPAPKVTVRADQIGAKNTEGEGAEG